MSRCLPEPNQRLRWGVSSAGGPSHCFFFYMPERKGCMAKDPLLKRSRSLREPNRRLRWGVSSAGGPSHCFSSLRRSVHTPSTFAEAFSGPCRRERVFRAFQSLQPSGPLPGAFQGPPKTLSRHLPKFADLKPKNPAPSGASQGASQGPAGCGHKRNF